MTDKQKIWAERVREWKTSGKTLREFAKDQPYKELTLRWWSTELRRRGILELSDPPPQARGRGGKKMGGIAMARVIRQRGSKPSTGIVVQVGAARIVVQRDFDMSVLRNVVRALEETR